MAIGSVTLEFADASTLDISRVNVRATAAQYDRRMFRSPFGEAWLVEGSGKREPDEFTLSCEVWADTIEDGAPPVNALLANLRAAVLVSAPIGVFVNAGVTSYAQSPIAGGYRLEVVMLAESGRLVNDEGILRFMSGPVWEMGG